MVDHDNRPRFENDPSLPHLELDQSLVFPDEARHRPFNPIRFESCAFEDMDVAHALGIPPPDKKVRIDVDFCKELGDGIWDYLYKNYGPVSGGSGPSSGPNTSEEDRTTIKYSLAASEPLTRWLPSTDEIRTVMGLAQSVAPMKIRPTVLDMGCLTGLVPYALAQTEQVEVIGTEVDELRLHANDPHFKHPNLKLLNISGWQAALLYAPEYSPEHTAEIADRLDLIIPILQNVDDVWYSMKDDEFKEYAAKFLKFMSDTRLLTAQRKTESPIDVVMTSNLPGEFIALTSIQEVLQPKAIVSVDYFNGNYMGFPENALTEDLVGKYYEGGENYHQITEWKGYSQRNWTDRSAWGWNHVADYEKARINVFVRNDVVPTTIITPNIAPMPWEEELGKLHNTPQALPY